MMANSFLSPLFITVWVFIGLVFFLWGMSLIRKRNAFRSSLEYTFFQILIPKKESKDDMEKERDQTSEMRKVVSIADHFFSTVHGIYRGGLQRFFVPQETLSFEYIAREGDILFFVGCSRTLAPLIEKQITSFYPEAILTETESPRLFSEKTSQSAISLITGKEFSFPLKTYTQFESTDPINNILNALSNASDEKGASAGIQILIRPVPDTWQPKARKKARELSEGKGLNGSWNPFVWLMNGVSVLFRGIENKNEQSNKKESDESQETVKAIESKSQQFAFETAIRVVTSSPQKRLQEMHMKSITNSFSQFNSPVLNSVGTEKWVSNRSIIRHFLLRSFPESMLWKKRKMILSTAELASLYHFPHTKFNSIPGVVWQNYKIVKAPNNIPKEGILLGHNVYRNQKIPIHIKKNDRFRHFYVIGQTGTGKSSIFQSMIRQDMENGDGLCVIDPHGSLIDSILPFVPSSRIDDVIIFDPSDTERPMGLNLLEAQTEEERDMVALDAMNLMIKLFDEEIFGPRIQDYFRNGVLTLMADPQGGSLTDIVKLFTDEGFQRAKISHVKNPIVRSFWNNQMAKTGAREKAEIIPYFAAKFGAFITNSMLRNIIGQTKSAFDFSKSMQEGKILLMNLSKGTTGDINSKLLGLILVSKLQMATLRRQKQLSEGRTPRDFFLYIDEFQNYVTDSIESILSEARKYRLSLNIAHQYINQIDTSNQKKGVNLKDAIFGNVGTMMCYKIGAQDAEYMAKEMAPSFTDHDLVNIDKYQAVIKLSIDTQPSKPFSITPLNPYIESGNEEMKIALKQISRLTYGRSKKFVEKEIFTRLDI